MVGVAYFVLIIFCFETRLVLCSDFCSQVCYCLDFSADCAKKNFSSVPSNVPKWTTHLYLNNNRIQILNNETLQHLPKLTTLMLSKNKIERIPKDAFAHQKQLKTLELNRNQITEIDALSFKSLEGLIKLRLKRNHIRRLKDGTFWGLNSIKTLELDYNLIQVVSKVWLYGLANLLELSLAFNEIERVEDDSWELCHNLIKLDMSNNKLKSINKETFKYLSELQKLTLNYNNISFIEEGAFSNTPNLKILQLNFNKLSWTVEDTNRAFIGLNSLSEFSMAGNNIKTINKLAFVGLKILNYLDLTNNNITSIQNNAFEEMPMLEILKLNTTTLICDCNLEWFAPWLLNTNIKTKAVCSYPFWSKGKSVFEIPIANFTCEDLPQPKLIEEPKVEIMALKGETIHLACKARSTSNGKMNFIWKMDNKDLDNRLSSQKEQTLDGKYINAISELVIRNVSHANAGKYQCIVFNTFGKTYSQKSTISVLIFPTFIKMPSNITVSAGATVKLECAAHGEPAPQIAWQKDGGNDFPAARERRMHVMPTDDVFFIINAKTTDMGVYSCTAKNLAGVIVANATLAVQEMPSFVKPMENKEITAGKPIVLECKSSGSPKPTLAWLKDGVPIHATERHFFTAEDQLMIIVDTVMSDAGKYECRMNNSLGTERGFSELHIIPGVVINEGDMMGIIIITVVCCAVGTSVVWVVIIYQTRKRSAGAAMVATAATEFPETVVVAAPTFHAADTASENSSCKDSGTGESARRSNDDLLPNDEYTIIINAEKEGQPKQATLVYTPNYQPYVQTTNHDRLDEDDDDDEDDVN